MLDNQKDSQEAIIHQLKNIILMIKIHLKAHIIHIIIKNHLNK
jgi:hypothetical protein